MTVSTEIAASMEAKSLTPEERFKNEAACYRVVLLKHSRFLTHMQKYMAKEYLHATLLSVSLPNADFNEYIAELREKRKLIKKMNDHNQEAYLVLAINIVNTNNKTFMNDEIGGMLIFLVATAFGVMTASLSISIPLLACSVGVSMFGLALFATGYHERISRNEVLRENGLLRR